MCVSVELLKTGGEGGSHIQFDQASENKLHPPDHASSISSSSSLCARWIADLRRAWTAVRIL